MDDDPQRRIVELLETLVSEQRAASARHADMLERQREALELQQRAMRRDTRLVASILVAVVVVLLVGYLGPYFEFWLVHR